MKRNPLSRLLSVLLCLCLVAGMLPTALAEEGVTVDVRSSVTLRPGANAELPLSLTEKSLSVTKWNVTGEKENGISAEIRDSILIVSADNDALNGATTTFEIVAEYVMPSLPGDDGSESTDSSTEEDGQKDTRSAEPSTGTATGTCTVKVEAPESEKPKVTSVTLSQNKISLQVDDSEKLTTDIIAEPNADTTLEWSSDKENIAAVDQNGNIQAKAVGTATITVQSKANPEAKDTCEVTVTEKPAEVIPVESITISASPASPKVGDTVRITAKLNPSNATNQSLTWSTNDSSILSPLNAGSGLIVTYKAEKAGTAKITVLGEGGKKAELSITVTSGTIPVTGVTLDKTTASIPINGTVKLTATVAPSNATNKKVTWSSSDTKVATVDGNGNVTGKAKGTATITVTTEDGSKTAKCTVNVGTASAITYTVAADDTVTLKASDFNSVCNGVYGTTLDYVIFDRSTSNGTLYYDYTTKDGGTKISTSTKYYSSNSASRSISSITFVPDGKSGDKATFPYTAYDTKGQRYAGTLEITIKSPSGNVKYETAKDEPVDFDSGDFDDVCRSITGSRLDYVTFTLPSSSRGTLYYDYGGKDEEKLSSSDKCYADEDDGDFGLDDITFVPKSGYTGTVTFNYSGRSTSRDSFSGTVTITISKTGSTLRYQIDEGEELDLDDSDFNDYCKDQTGANLDYVTFDLPGSSRGTLYYKYGSRDEDDISSSDKFYRSSSPRLDDVTFVPKSGYTGIVSIDFTGRSVDNDRFSGTVKIEVGDTGSGDISYTAPAGSAVSFVLSDFNDLCEDETGERLDYVTFDLPSSSRGTLYYQYGKSGEEKLSSSDKYYRSGSPRLEDISFVPASSFSGTLEIKFSGRSTDNDRFSGTVAITYTSVKDPAIVRYTSDGGAVNFQSNDFVSACSIRGAGNLVSVKFNTPSSGTLYYGYTSPTSYGGVVNPLISFSTGTGNASISGVTYVPKAGYSGTVTLTYTGTDSKGATFTGNIAITVTPTTGSRFTDMGNYSWAAASVDFLYENGITTGTTDTTYGPAGNITRGDFVLMLARAFNLTGGDPSNSFSDVPANSYYAQAIASAKALGIAQGGGSTFNPTGALTRQDAMVLLHRTLSRTGKTIPDASASYLSRFSDGGSVASYAQSSVAALVQAGVIQGDTSGKLNPQGSLTRAEMAVILHRVLTL